MKKYSAIFLTSLKNTLNYRGELIMWSIIDAMPLLGNLILWSVAFVGKDIIGGMTQQTIITYYILGYVFQQLTGSHFEDYYVKQILSGNISGWLLKPLSLKKSMVVEEVSWRVTGSIIMLTPIALLMMIMDIHLEWVMPITSFLILLGILIVGYFIDAVFSLAIVAQGFVFEEARSLMHLKWMVSWLFSGSMIPFELMPVWLEKISSALPFQTRYYLPTAIYMGHVSPQAGLRYLSLMIGWAILLYFWIRWFWAKNVRKFTAVGS